MPVLHDGREVQSDSLDWLRECEAVSILSMPMADRLPAMERRARKRAGLPEDTSNLKPGDERLRAYHQMLTELQVRVRAVWKATHRMVVARVEA